MRNRVNIGIEPLTKKSFAPFGTVIELEGAETFSINNGAAERFHALCELDVAQEGGRPILSVFRAQACQFPIDIAMMERHPLGSQAFIPFDRTHRWLVVVATGEKPEAKDCRGFWAAGQQGVQYDRGVWHHPLLSLRDGADFLVADRIGDGENLEEALFKDGPGILSFNVDEMGTCGSRQIAW